MSIETRGSAIEGFFFNLVRTKLSADERPKYRYVFTVEGSGEFPYDMLRYDACYPANVESALSPHHHELRKINLVHLSDSSVWSPTVGRWRSFGWSICRESI